MHLAIGQSRTWDRGGITEQVNQSVLGPKDITRHIRNLKTTLQKLLEVLGTKKQGYELV